MADHGRAEGRDDILAAHILVDFGWAHAALLVCKHRRIT